MARRDFERDGQLLSSISAHDLKKAEEEERAGKPISSKAVQVLLKHLRAMGGKVMGSDYARAVYRPQIWGTTAVKGPPNVWLTINPVDLHDPVVQVFCGEEINMDDFDRTAGPGRKRRAENVARNPYAAARYFHYIIMAVMETLFNIQVTTHKVEGGMGVLGEVEAYFGVVEAQGRGTLHLHMLIWLKNAPTSEEMHELLQEEHFQNKLKTYLERNFLAHVDGLDTETAKNIPKDNELPYSRPPNPSGPDYPEKRAERERTAARTQQVHTCTTRTCLILNKKNGKHTCKRRAPWKISESYVVKPNGEILVRRTLGYVNTWVRPITECLACNNDGKFLTNGRETRQKAWYVTCYATKKQRSTHNMSALVAQGVAFHAKRSSLLDEVRDRNRLLLFRCFQALNREMEYSAPQVISHLMGWGDSFTSHKYEPSVLVILQK